MMIQFRLVIKFHSRYVLIINNFICKFRDEFTAFSPLGFVQSSRESDLGKA